MLQKHDTLGCVKDRPGRGRKRKLLEMETKKIVKKARAGKPATDIARQHFFDTGQTIHPQTVRNVLHDQGLACLKIQEIEVLSESNRRARLEYAQRMRNTRWNNVVFSDEKTFVVGQGLERAWQDPHNRRVRQVVRHPQKLHVWAAAGYYMKSDLYFFTKNLNSELYRQIL